MELAGYCTIGHSNRDVEEFEAMLHATDVGLVVDERSFPRSRCNPVYNIDTLRIACPGREIGYRHISALGGRRKIQSAVLDELNAIWRNWPAPIG